MNHATGCACWQRDQREQAHQNRERGGERRVTRGVPCGERPDGDGGHQRGGRFGAHRQGRRRAEYGVDHQRGQDRPQARHRWQSRDNGVGHDLRNEIGGHGHARDQVAAEPGPRIAARHHYPGQRDPPPRARSSTCPRPGITSCAGSAGAPVKNMHTAPSQGSIVPPVPPCGALPPAPAVRACAENGCWSGQHACISCHYADILRIHEFWGCSGVITERAGAPAGPSSPQATAPGPHWSSRRQPRGAGGWPFSASGAVWGPLPLRGHT